MLCQGSNEAKPEYPSWGHIKVNQGSILQAKNSELWSYHRLLKSESISFPVLNLNRNFTTLRQNFKLIHGCRSVIGWRSRTQYLIGCERHLASIILKALLIFTFNQET